MKFETKMKEIATCAKWACISIPMTFISLLFGESFFQVPFILLIVFYFPGMYAGDYMALNYQNTHEYLVLAMIYFIQYLYFFIAILIVRYAYKTFKRSNNLVSN